MLSKQLPKKQKNSILHILEVERHVNFILYIFLKYLYNWLNRKHLHNGVLCSYKIKYEISIRKNVFLYIKAHSHIFFSKAQSYVYMYIYLHISKYVHWLA